VSDLRPLDSERTIILHFIPLEVKHPFINSFTLLNQNDNSTDVTLILQNGEYVWSKTIQGYILGAFFWGYLVTQIPGGWVATKFGGKQVFGVSMLLGTLVTFITPVAAQTSYKFLIALRVILGICSVSLCFNET